MTVAANTNQVAEDAIYYFARQTIHPDPEQPRVHPDDGLQASIDQLGIITPIIVRPHPEIENEWMIVDGERRWVGARVSAEIPCRIRLDLEDPADRLITQLTANTGKPLSPIEQARAFKKILDESESLSQAELAKRLGIPRSTIGDRIRLTELHPAWLDAISAGKLQVSHAPILSAFSAVPADYQAKAAKAFFEDYRIKRYLDGGGSVPIDEMPRMLYVAFRDYIKEIAKTPGYRGPTIEIKNQYSTSKTKYAADITIWRPCFRKYENARAKKARGHSRSTSYGGGHYMPPAEKAVKALKAAGFDPPLRPVGTKQVLPNEGEAVIFNECGWQKDLHPTVLLNLIDPSTIVYVKGNFGGDQLFTSDVAAVAAAQRAYREHVDEVAKKELAPLRAKLTPAVLEKYAVRGAGVPHLLMALQPERGAPKVIALALGLAINGPVDEEINEDDDDAILANDSVPGAEKLLSAVAAVAALELKVPNEWEISQKINKGLTDVPFKVSKATKVVKVAESLGVDVVKTVSANDPRPEHKSKKQQKREARAAGKQVGDPERAKKDPTINEILGLQTDKVVAFDLDPEEEELVEA